MFESGGKGTRQKGTLTPYAASGGVVISFIGAVVKRAKEGDQKALALIEQLERFYKSIVDSF